MQARPFPTSRDRSTSRIWRQLHQDQRAAYPPPSRSRGYLIIFHLQISCVSGIQVHEKASNIMCVRDLSKLNLANLSNYMNKLPLDELLIKREVKVTPKCF